MPPCLGMLSFYRGFYFHLFPNLVSFWNRNPFSLSNAMGFRDGIPRLIHISIKMSFEMSFATLLPRNGFPALSFTMNVTPLDAEQSMAEYHRVWQSITEYHTALQSSQSITKCHKVSQSMPEYHRVSQSMVEYHRVSKTAAEYRRVLSQTITEYHKVSQSIAEYHTASHADHRVKAQIRRGFWEV